MRLSSKGKHRPQIAAGDGAHTRAKTLYLKYIRGLRFRQERMVTMVATMDLTEIARNVELQNVTLEQAEAVLDEVIRYFEHDIKPDTAEAFLFVSRKNHFNILLYLVQKLLAEISLELGNVETALIQQRKSLLKEAPQCLN